MTVRDQDGLMPKQRRFVEEYLLNANATRAAIRAGYSETSARSSASRLLAVPSVARAIETGQEALFQSIRVKQDDVIHRLLRQADYDGEGSTHQARVKALEILGKHLGMFGDHPASEGPARITLVIKEPDETAT